MDFVPCYCNVRLGYPLRTHGCPDCLLVTGNSEVAPDVSTSGSSDVEVLSYVAADGLYSPASTIVIGSSGSSAGFSSPFVSVANGYNGSRYEFLLLQFRYHKHMENHGLFLYLLFTCFDILVSRALVVVIQSQATFWTTRLWKRQAQRGVSLSVHCHVSSTA